MKAFWLYLAVTLSGIVTASVVGGYVTNHVLESLRNILNYTQVTHSSNAESMVSSAMEDINLLKTNQLVAVFERKCFVIDAFSEYIDLEIYEDNPRKQIEIKEMLAESTALLQEMVDSGVCQAETLTNLSK